MKIFLGISGAALLLTAVGLFVHLTGAPGIVVAIVVCLMAGAGLITVADGIQ